MPDVMKTVGRYEILREVGRGGMAMVFLARQTDLDRFVALKELGAFHASDPSFAQRFLRESRVAGSLSHPNICTVHDYFEHDGTPYIAMEYIERGSLRPYIGHMTTAQTGGVLEGLLAGLAHGEQHGIVHRDLKPENLMVTSDGRVKIADFGIAKATNQMQTGAFLTATGTTVGTPTYMAPEQAMAQEIGPPTDLYSVGCMAFEMFTGRVPFHDTEAPMAILLRHVNEPIPPAKSVDPTIDQDISDWIEHLLHKDPTQRIQSANEAWDEFEEIIIGLLGPRWRREARLVERAQQIDTPAPLTPAPFEGTTPSDAAVSDEFQSFAWGTPAAEAPPGPATPPPSAAAPVPPPPEVGPPTPPPSEAVTPPEADGSDGAGTLSDEEVDGFVTFGAPAAEPAEAELPAAEAPAAEAPVVEPPVVEPPTEPVEPPTEPFDPTTEENFETYVAPAPLRPPTDEPPADAPALPVQPAEPTAAPPPPPPPPPPPVTPAPEPVAPQEDIAATVMPQALRPMPESLDEDEPRQRMPERVREPGSGRGVLIGFGIAALVAAVLGFLISSGGGGSGEGGTPTKASSSATLEALFPDSWSELGSPPEVPGMTLDDPIAVAPKGGGGTSVVFGVVKEEANNSTLLPAGFLTALGAGGKTPKRDAVELSRAKLQAYRYEKLQPKGSKSAVTVFAVPTSEGVATLACVDPGADCEGIANTLKLTSGSAFPVGPSKDYAAALSKELATLNKQVASGRSGLKAKTPAAQAAAAHKLAAAYAAAAKGLQGLKLSPADKLSNLQLATALDQTGAAYRKLGSAASKGDRGGYGRAGNAVANGEKAIGQALDGLKAAGYGVGGS
jgi:serine/threonine protein kinase